MSYDGPYLIAEKLSDHDYRVQMNEEKKKKVFHYDKLKPYMGVHKPSWGITD